jgi:hypothetical protein
MTEIENATEDQTSAGKVQLPDTEAFRLNRTVPEAPVEDGDAERIAVFGALVTADDDIVGLVAYSIYKQHENDWLMAFRKAKGRDPSEDESSAFIVGEGTARRLSTYRHLAEATLAGRGPQVPAGSSTSAFVQRSHTAAARYTPASERRPAKAFPGVVVTIALAAVFIVAVLLAARYGLPGIAGPARP